MDVQGHERRVLGGATAVLQREIPIVMEYWPYGLRLADDMEALHELLSANYRQVIDVRASMSANRPFCHIH